MMSPPEVTMDTTQVPSTENVKPVPDGVLAAVVSHKLLEAFALGLAIYRARFKLWLNIVILLGYAFATPIGKFFFHLQI